MRLASSNRSHRGVSTVFIIGVATLTIIFHLVISLGGYGCSQNDLTYRPCSEALMDEGKLLGHLKAIETKLDALLLTDGVTNATFTQVLVSLKGEFQTVIDEFNSGMVTAETMSDSETVNNRIAATIEKAKMVDTVPAYERPKIRLYVGVFVSNHCNEG